MKKKVKRKINRLNTLVFVSLLISGGLLLHDFIVYGIIPLFNGKFYMVSYFGLFIDFIAFMMLEASVQYIKEWFGR